MLTRRHARWSLLIALALWAASPRPASPEALPETLPPRALGMDQALELAARNRPELEALRADLTSAGLRLEHSALPPNPELELEWDNLGGDLPEGEARETTVALRQPLEFGGKSTARQNHGRAEIARLHQEQQTAWLDIAAEVRTSFVETLAARERLQLQEEGHRIAGELAALTHERVRAGDLPVTEEIRAAARTAETAAQTEKYRRLLAGTELALIAALAEPPDHALSPTGDLLSEEVIPEREALLAGLPDAPLLTLRRGEKELAAAGLQLARANGWADPSLAVAVRETPDLDGRALLLGVSIPLPLFQRNQDGLADAAAMLTKAAASEKAEERRLQAETLKTLAILVAADREARTLRDEVLPRAHEAETAVREGFRAGKFRYSDVLEARQTLVEIKARHLDVLVDLNLAAVALDRLIGRPEFPQLSDNSATDRSIP